MLKKKPTESWQNIQTLNAGHEKCKKTKSPKQDLPRLQSTFCLAQKVGEKLGKRQILLKKV
jgi:hypothetical protein